MNEPDARREPERSRGLLRLRCPHCNAEYPLWFLPEGFREDVATGTRWEAWLDTRCGDCGNPPRLSLGRLT